MEFPSQLLSESNVFQDPLSTNYSNLKLKSPSPFKDNNTHESPIKRPFDESLESSISSLSPEPPITKSVSTIDIYRKLLSTTTGKDKIAKTLQYLLNILKYFTTITRRFIIDEKFSNLSINPLIHYKNPLKYFKLLLFLNSTVLEKKINIITSNISLFRFALRFGGTPFRIKSLLSTLKQYSKSPSIEQFYKIFINEGFLQDLINLNYGILDELYLLIKLNLITNKSIKNYVGPRLDLAWYYDILLTLKKTWYNLNLNKQQQLQITIQFEVKKRASKLSKKLIEDFNGNSPIKLQILKEFNNKAPSKQLNDELESLKHEELLLNFDLYKNLADFISDSIDVWNIKTHPLIPLISGLSSGAIALGKNWISTERELLNNS